MIKLLRLFALITVFLGAVSAALGQAATADTAFVQESVIAAVQSYRNAIGRHAHLFTGQEYVDYRKYLREGHQFFRTDEFSEGAVFYEGVYYMAIPMVYDVVRDVVVIRSNLIKQLLMPEKVDYFELHGHHFVNYNRDSLAASGIQQGYYDLLFRNKILLLAKRTKSIKEEAHTNKMWQVFSEEDRYYIRNNHQYYQVKRKRDVYAALKDRKKELQKFARANRLDFRDQKEASFLALAKYYSSLKD